MNNIERDVLKSESDNQKGDTRIFEDELFLKLYISKDIEGERNKEIMGTVKELAKSLEEQDSRIIGVAPYGSVVRGYRIEGKSDLDVYVLYDDREEIGEKEWGANISVITDETQETFDKIYKPKNLSPIDIAVNAININPELINTREKGDLNYYRNVETYAPIFLVVTGKKIDDYREYWVKKVSEMSEDQRDKLIYNSVKWLTRYADFNPDKLRGRLGISREKLGEIMDTREDLWRKRVKHLLKIEQ